jgi:hypothetical protein
LAHLPATRGTFIAAVVIAGVSSIVMGAPATAQTEPYTRGTVAPASPCPAATLRVDPPGVLTAGGQFTLITEGQPPNSLPNFYSSGAFVGTVRADAAGKASVMTSAPTASAKEFEVAVAGPCGTVTRTVGLRAVAAAQEFARGLARTGFWLLPLLLAALAMIVTGRKLVVRSRGRGRPRDPATRLRVRTPAMRVATGAEVTRRSE